MHKGCSGWLWRLQAQVHDESGIYLDVILDPLRCSKGHLQAIFDPIVACKSFTAQ